MPQPIKLYNTDGRQLQDFYTIEPGVAKMYCCGPTVYNYAHIGNLRTYVFEDLLRRVLEDAGYQVIHVVNITDVGHLTGDGDDGEDKIIKSAREKGMSVWDIARFFTEAFFQDWDALRLRRPTVVCRATDHIPDMIAMIRRLEEKGYTYLAGGNVYFDTSRFPEYGRLALLDRQNSESQSRVEADPNKRHPRDFVLWFTRSKFQDQAMTWDSPWGRGYPGWHIECSAMSTRYLGERFDIHCGGVDHIPVHHTNEIAQSECALGHRWVNFWLHGEFLILQKEKMSKSSGEFLTLSSLVERGFDPMDYRYFLFGAHYRTQLVFSWEALEAARRGRMNLLERLRDLTVRVPDARSLFNDPRPDELEEVQQLRARLREDLNAPLALADLWTLVRQGGSAPERLLRTLGWADGLFELGLSQALEEVQVPEQVRRWAEERQLARSRKDWKSADELRQRIAEAGWVVEDRPEGYRLRRKVTSDV